ncbi:MAG: type IA DNA topoisomerase, partial [Gemmatimonadaceae bacterium]
AGRVQTPALHLLCEREREILAFVPEEYWTVGVAYGEGFDAVVPAEPAAGAQGGEGGKLTARRFPGRDAAEAARDEARRHPHVVRAVDRRRTQRRPEPPYTTSTLQQDASRKLRLSARQAADQAQALFEAGYITYHRTDSTRVSDEAAREARDHIAAEHPDALPERPPQARTKAGAQDAHEAIRPTALDGDDSPPKGTERLYALIRARFLASQCRPATFDRTTVWIDAGPVPFAAEGAVLVEPGFLHYWRPYARQEERDLPEVSPGQELTPGNYAIAEKRTSPPPRYDTGALIRKLELSGIGRPATFASIIETLLRRDYVIETTTAAAAADGGDDDADGGGGRPAARARSGAGGGKRVLQPTALGLQVDGLLSASLPTLVGEEYTAAMEAALDRIERQDDGETRQSYLRRWYDDFRAAMRAALPRAAAYRAEQGLTGRGRGGRTTGDGNGRGEETAIICDRCGEASYRKLTRRKGKGTFLACPACNMMRDVRARTRPAGCPKCGSTLMERRGKRKGVKFWGCVRYGLPTGACDYVEWQDPPAGGRATEAATSAATSAAKGGARRKTARSAAATRPAATPTVAVVASRSPRKPCPRCEVRFLDVVPAASGERYLCPDHACGFTLRVGARRRALPCARCGGLVVEGDDGWGCAKCGGM